MASFQKILILLPVSVGLVQAQTLDTAIFGTVADPSGAVIPSASVTITQPATGRINTVSTSNGGRYEVRYLFPGQYTVESSATGFKTERRTGVVLQTGQQARLDFRLKLSQVAERTDVVAEAPLIQTENAALGEVISQERIQSLPLNGWGFLNLATLTPGVTVSTDDQFAWFLRVWPGVICRIYCPDESASVESASRRRPPTRPGDVTMSFFAGACNSTTQSLNIVLKGVITVAKRW